MKEFSIYRMTNNVNGKEYIGQTARGIRNRFCDHKKASKHGRGGSLNAAIRKYGHENFCIEQLCTLDTEEDMNEMERFVILCANTKAPYGYNLSDGGDRSSRGVKHTEEQRRKNRDRQKGTQLGNQNAKGTVHTPEWRKEHSEKMKGNKFAKGSKRTEAEKKNLSRLMYERLAKKKESENKSINIDHCILHPLPNGKPICPGAKDVEMEII